MPVAFTSVGTSIFAVAGSGEAGSGVAGGGAVEAAISWALTGAGGSDAATNPKFPDGTGAILDLTH